MPRSLRRASKRPRQPSRRQLQPPQVRQQRLQSPVPLQPLNLRMRPLNLLLEQLTRRLEQVNRRLSHRQAPRFPGVFSPFEVFSRHAREKTSVVRLRHKQSMICCACSSGFGIDMAPANSFSFPKTRRLTRASEFERVKHDGVTRRGKLLMLNVAPMENSGPWRVGFITSRRVGGAVVRNRVRRHLREIVRQNQHALRGEFWMVLIARSDAANASYQQLEHEWLRLARRASILL